MVITDQSRGRRARREDNIALPSPPVSRWTPRSKAAVVAAVLRAQLTLEDLGPLYGISVDEGRRWLELYRRHAIEGLKSTRCQAFRGAADGSAGSAAVLAAYLRRLEIEADFLRKRIALMSAGKANSNRKSDRQSRP